MEVLKEFRLSLNITAKEFADSIKVSKSLYDKVETGVRKPSRQFLTKLKRQYPQFDVNIFFTIQKHETWEKEAKVNE